MKPYHVHVGVTEPPSAIRLYPGLYGQESPIAKEFCVRGMLKEARINCAISTRRGKNGLGLLGFQADSGEELKILHQWVKLAVEPVVGQKDAVCCYSESDEYMTLDPAGIAWKTFPPLGDVPVLGERSVDGGACCASILTEARFAFGSLRHEFL